MDLNNKLYMRRSTPKITINHSSAFLSAREVMPSFLIYFGKPQIVSLSPKVERNSQTVSSTLSFADVSSLPPRISNTWYHTKFVKCSTFSSLFLTRRLHIYAMDKCNKCKLVLGLVDLPGLKTNSDKKSKEDSKLLEKREQTWKETNKNGFILSKNLMEHETKRITKDPIAC